MSSTIYKLQKIYAKLCKSYNLPLLLEKIYLVLLIDKYTCKSCIFLFHIKEKFFDGFKFRISCIKEASKKKLGYLLIYSKKDSLV